MSTIYCFSGIKYHIHGLTPKVLSEFSVFRTDSDDRTGFDNIDVYISSTDEFLKPSGKNVFVYPSGVSVYINENIENRYFFNSISRGCYAMLSETMDLGNAYRKDLFIHEDCISGNYIDERTLFNCIAPEKDLVRFGRLLLHSSFIETERGAILFTAPCQTGKSTLAELWRRYRGAIVRNGDRSCIWKENGNWYAGGIPWCGTSGIMHNVKVPLLAIVVLSQGPENVISRMKLREAIPNLMKQTTINPWDNEMISMARDKWFELLPDIPIYHLSCLPDQGAVDTLADELGGF